MPNRLAKSKSPYLLQHADNPVDWYPWGEEGFEAARREDKPIFLSIGYSTCHWCHVMAHESFEDPEVAELMNETFINIKVDREERPDIDDIYMTVCQMLTRSGGWPLTVILTPDKEPFFAGTYFPKESRFGRVGMVELIPQIADLWQNRRDEILDSAAKITGALREYSTQASGEDLDPDILHLAYNQLNSQFDEQHGGFGNRPKFPTPHNFLFLLRYWKRFANPQALYIVEHSLQQMRLGGIYDHIGHGFHRYSTDRAWLLPHFEKMLYDQALLTMAYTETYQATGSPSYMQTAREILTYVLRDMTAPEGGFYSAEDADSEGEEGKFYVWTIAEIRDILSKDDADLFIETYNLSEPGNFREEATGLTTGANIPHLSQPPEDERLKRIRQTLFEHREARVHPSKDDKILTDWNGLMIAALAKAARVFDEPAYTEAASRAVTFILERLRDAENHLLHRFRDGAAGISAMLNDYVFLIWGLIELYETTFEVTHLQTAVDLNQELLGHFWDDQNGGFFTVTGDKEDVLVRRKEIYDGAVPSGNSVAMLNLLRLGRLTAAPELEAKAAQLTRAFSESIESAAMAHTQFLCGFDFALGPTHEVTIAGSPDADDTRAMLGALWRHYAPNKVTLLRPPGKTPEIVALAGFTQAQTPIDSAATAYVCQDYQCALPTNEVAKMLELLG